jgi:fructose-bisphosphate aldolase, class II
MKTLRDYLEWARSKQVAIGHFNISDSEGFKAVAEVARELEVPVIIGVSEGEREFIGVDEVRALVDVERANGQPIFLNADHSYSVEKVKEAVDAGFDSVIFDGAALPFDENIEQTMKCVEYARITGSNTLVEAELGFIGKSSKVLDELPDGVSEETQTDPSEARRFVEATSVDLLAPSVGNIHGMVKSGNPKLNIERIKAISNIAQVPLVLHGGSGISNSDFVSAIDAGIRIIHINTEIRVAYKEGIIEGIKSDEVAPYKFMARGIEEMKRVITDRLKLFNKIKLE